MKKKVLLTISFINLILFFLMLLFTYNNLFDIDALVNSSIINIQNNNLTNLFSWISYLFEPLNMIILSFLIASLLLIIKKKRQALFFVLTMSLGGIFIYIIKEIVIRARPLNSLIIETGYSFPSGHALISIILFGLIILYFLESKYSKAISFFCILAILFIGFDRIYLNVHWLSDVLGGWFFGSFLLFLSLYLFNTYKTKPNPLNHKHIKNPNHH